MSKFGERLKELRATHSITQKQLAEALSTTDGSIRDWELRNIETDYDTLIKIAKFFDVSLDYLLGIKEYE